MDPISDWLNSGGHINKEEANTKLSGGNWGGFDIYR